MKKLEANLYELIHAVTKFQKNKVFSETCNKLNPAELKLFEIVKPNVKITMTELAKSLSTSKGASTLTVDKLVKKKLMLRSYDENDRRIVYISLSHEGEKVFKNYINCKTKVFGNLAKSFKDFDINVCNKILEKLNTELKK